jgi:hypothetical protein
VTGSRASGPGCAQHPCGASDADARQQSPIHCSGAAECCILCGARISCRKPHGVRPLLPCVPSPPCLVWQQSACAEGRASHTGAGTRDGLERGRSRFGESELQHAHCTNCEAAPPGLLFSVHESRVSNPREMLPPGSQHAGLMPTWSQPRKSKSPASASIALRSGCAPVVGILLLLVQDQVYKHLPFQTRYTKTKIVYSSLGPGAEPKDGETGGLAHPSPPRSFRTGGLTSPSHGRSQRGTRRDGAPADSAACPCRRRK